MNLIEASPVDKKMSNVQVEGSVLHFNSETPAEKAKGRTSMAERMIDPDALQIKPNPLKATNKKPEDLLRLSNDVLNLNEQPASSARRMTITQPNRSEVLTRLALT